VLFFYLKEGHYQIVECRVDQAQRIHQNWQMKQVDPLRLIHPTIDQNFLAFFSGANQAE